MNFKYNNITFDIVWIIYIILICFFIYDIIPKKYLKENLDLASLVNTATAVANVATAATSAATTAAAAPLPTQDFGDPCNSTTLLCKPQGVKDGDTKGCPLTCAGTPNPKDPNDSTNLKCRVAPNYNKSTPCGDCLNYPTLTTDQSPFCKHS